MLLPPKTDELSPYYQTYLKYINSGTDLLKFIKEQAVSTQQFLSEISEVKAEFRYAPGKWMLKEVVGHVCDTERILSYRALRFSRADKTPLHGFDENFYTPNSNYHNRTLKNISDELLTVRHATISLISNMDDSMFDRKGVANDNEVSVRALIYMIAVHQKHHLQVINEKYLSI